MTGRAYRYDAEFFDYVDRGSQRSATRVVALLAAELKVKSVLDIGCGRGAWLAAWTRLGVIDVLA